MLVVPMKDNDNNIIGVLQLINKQNENGDIVTFEKADEKLISSLSSQAAVSITNSNLMLGLENLLNAFMQSIATAIGQKSKYTQGHINRVAQLSLLIANEINNDTTGIYKDKYFNQNQLKELDVAAWMHDIGKITTPDFIINKSTKLQKVYDRIESIKLKFHILKLQQPDMTHKLNDDFEFLSRINLGGEFMSDKDIYRVKNIAKFTIDIDGVNTPLLTEDEVDNLIIKKGTLSSKERTIINDHAKVSLDMLNALPFPKKLSNVASIAGAHHEKLVGGGYPLGLRGDEISFEARIVAIADIFEALTSHDRPYKTPNTLSAAFKVLGYMVQDGEIDGKIVDFFINSKVYEEYAKEYLIEEQLDI